MSSKYKIRITQNELNGYAKARLQISVGQPYHEDNKFLATALWVAENFSNVSINLCDTLQRHNLIYHGYSPFQAYDKALSDGKEWLQRNGEALIAIPNLKITHWEDWKKGSGWNTALQDTKSLHETDRTFFDLVEKSAEEFWRRRQGKDGYPEERKADFFKASRDYILEEIAVSMLMSEKDIAEIYPGTFPLPLYYLRDNGISSPASMTSIAFLKKNSAVPQAA